MRCTYGCDRTKWIRTSETCDNAGNYANVTIVSGCAHTLPDDGANYYPAGEAPGKEKALAKRRLRQARYVC